MKLFFHRLLPLLLIGFAAGLCNGLLGAGGGILVVFGLRRLLSDTLEDPHAVFASAIAVMLPLSLLSSLGYARLGHLPEGEWPLLILPAVAGGVLGAILMRKMALPLLSRIFAAVVLLSGVLLVI